MINNHSALMPDYYQILDLPASAAPTEIRSAARQMFYKHHADRGGKPEKQILIKKASKILLNPIERENYDRHYRSYRKIRAASIPAQPDQPDQPAPHSRRAGRWSSENFISRIKYQFEDMVKNEQKANQARKAERIEEIQKEFLAWKRTTGQSYRQEWKRLKGVFGEKIKAQKIFLRFSLALGIGSLLALALAIWSASRGSLSYRWFYYLSLALLAGAALAALRKLAANWMKANGSLTRISAEDALDLIKDDLFKRLQNEEYRTREIELSYYEKNWEQLISEHVTAANDIQTARRIEKINNKRADYLSRAKKMLDVISVEADFDTPEKLVVKKISVALFLMGFLPISYEPRSSMVTFHDGEEDLLVRFRHRPGNPSNISYLKRMVEKMRVEKIPAGYIFCPGGVSETGIQLAHQNRVSLYSLDRLNDWIANVAGGSYCGPAEHLFLNLERMERFLRQI